MNASNTTNVSFAPGVGSEAPTHHRNPWLQANLGGITGGGTTPTGRGNSRGTGRGDGGRGNGRGSGRDGRSGGRDHGGGNANLTGSGTTPTGSGGNRSGNRGRGHGGVPGGGTKPTGSGSGRGGNRGRGHGGDRGNGRDGRSGGRGRGGGDANLTTATSRSDRRGKRHSDKHKNSNRETNTVTPPPGKDQREAGKSLLTFSLLAPTQGDDDKKPALVSTTKAPAPTAPAPAARAALETTNVVDFSEYIAAAKEGDEEALQKVKNGFAQGKVQKDVLEQVIRTHHATRNDGQSHQVIHPWPLNTDAGKEALYALNQLASITVATDGMNMAQEMFGVLSTADRDIGFITAGFTAVMSRKDQHVTSADELPDAQVYGTLIGMSNADLLILINDPTSHAEFFKRAHQTALGTVSAVVRRNFFYRDEWLARTYSADAPDEEISDMFLQVIQRFYPANTRAVQRLLKDASHAPGQLRQLIRLDQAAIRYFEANNVELVSRDFKLSADLVQETMATENTRVAQFSNTIQSTPLQFQGGQYELALLNFIDGTASGRIPAIPRLVKSNGITINNPGTEGTNIAEILSSATFTEGGVTIPVLTHYSEAETEEDGQLLIMKSHSPGGLRALVEIMLRLRPLWARGNIATQVKMLTTRAEYPQLSHFYRTVTNNAPYQEMRLSKADVYNSSEVDLTQLIEEHLPWFMESEGVPDKHRTHLKAMLQMLAVDDINAAKQVLLHREQWRVFRSWHISYPQTVLHGYGSHTSNRETQYRVEIIPNSNSPSASLEPTLVIHQFLSALLGVMDIGSHRVVAKIGSAQHENIRQLHELPDENDHAQLMGREVKTEWDEDGCWTKISFRVSTSYPNPRHLWDVRKIGIEGSHAWFHYRRDSRLKITMTETTGQVTMLAGWMANSVPTSSRSHLYEDLRRAMTDANGTPPPFGVDAGTVHVEGVEVRAMLIYSKKRSHASLIAHLCGLGTNQDRTYENYPSLSGCSFVPGPNTSWAKNNKTHCETAANQQSEYLRTNLTWELIGLPTELDLFDRSNTTSIANLIATFSVTHDNVTIRSPIRRLTQKNEGVLSVDFDKNKLQQMSLIGAELPAYINNLLLPYGTERRVILRTNTGTTFGSLPPSQPATSSPDVRPTGQHAPSGLIPAPSSGPRDPHSAPARSIPTQSSGQRDRSPDAQDYVSMADQVNFDGFPSEDSDEIVQYDTAGNDTSNIGVIDEGTCQGRNIGSQSTTSVEAILQSQMEAMGQLLQDMRKEQVTQGETLQRMEEQQRLTTTRYEQQATGIENITHQLTQFEGTIGNIASSTRQIGGITSTLREQYNATLTATHLQQSMKTSIDEISSQIQALASKTPTIDEIGKKVHAAVVILIEDLLASVDTVTMKKTEQIGTQVTKLITDAMAVLERDAKTMEHKMDQIAEAFNQNSHVLQVSADVITAAQELVLDTMAAEGSQSIDEDTSPVNQDAGAPTETGDQQPISTTATSSISHQVHHQQGTQTASTRPSATPNGQRAPSELIPAPSGGPRDPHPTTTAHSGGLELIPAPSGGPRDPHPTTTAHSGGLRDTSPDKARADNPMLDQAEDQHPSTNLALPTPENRLFQNTPFTDSIMRLSGEVKAMEANMDAAKAAAFQTPRRMNSSSSSESSAQSPLNLLTQLKSSGTSDDHSSSVETPKVSLFGIGGRPSASRQQMGKPSTDGGKRQDAPESLFDTTGDNSDPAESSDESSTVKPTFPVQQCYTCSKNRTIRNPLQPCPHCGHLHHRGCLNSSGNCFDCHEALASDSSVGSVNAPINNNPDLGQMTCPDSPTQNNPSSPSEDEVEVIVIDSPSQSNVQPQVERDDQAPPSPAQPPSPEEADLSDATNVQERDHSNVRPPVPRRRQPAPPPEDNESPSARSRRLVRKATRNHPHATR